MAESFGSADRNASPLLSDMTHFISHHGQEIEAWPPARVLVDQLSAELKGAHRRVKAATEVESISGRAAGLEAVCSACREFTPRLQLVISEIISTERDVNRAFDAIVHLEPG
jgi:hypothetical protein